MEFGVSQIVGKTLLCTNFQDAKRRLEERGYLLVVENEQPQMVIMSLSQFEIMERGHENQNVNHQEPAASSAVSLSVTGVEELGFGAYVRGKIEWLFHENRIPLEELERLCDLDYTRRTFKISSYSMLKKVIPGRNLREQRMDANGHGRYYDKIFFTQGKKYILTNHWVEHTSRARFETWLNQF